MEVNHIFTLVQKKIHIQRKYKSEFRTIFNNDECFLQVHPKCARHMFIEPPTSETNLSFCSFTFSLCRRHCRGGEVISCNVCLFPLFHKGDVLGCKAAQLVDLHKHTSGGI